MKGLALQSYGPIPLRFNTLGQSFGEGLVSLFSFPSPLVREIVPYTISDRRKIFEDMKYVLWKRIKIS